MKKDFNKTWKHFLTEGFIKYDRTTQKEIAKQIEKFRNISREKLNRILYNTGGGSVYFRTNYEIPYSRILEERDLQNDRILNGFIIFHYYHSIYGASSHSEAQSLLKRNWVTEGDRGSFANKFVDDFYKNKVYDLVFEIVEPLEEDEAAGYIAIRYQNFYIGFNLGLSPHLDASGIARHELQHLTQLLYSIAMHYSSAFEKQNYDISRVLKVSDKEMYALPETYGIGKKGYTEPVTSNEFQDYLADPAEFETHVSDLADMYVTYLLNNYIDRDQLAIGRIKESFDNVFDLRNFIKPRVEIKEVYSKIITSYIRDFGITEMASFWTSHLFNDEGFRQEFEHNAYDRGRTDYEQGSWFIELKDVFEVYSHRQKEFFDKLLINVRDMLFHEAESPEAFLERLNYENK